MDNRETKVLSVRVTDELWSILKERARLNNRSLGGEITQLIESGLAADNEELARLFKIMRDMNTQS